MAEQLRDKSISAVQLNRITGEIIDAAIHVHRKLGPGLLESVYGAVLARELCKRNMHVQAEVPIPVHWDGLDIQIGFRADLIVDSAVIVELKSIEQVARVHRKQLLTYLRLANMRVGLLINFGTEVLKDGIYRVVNNLPE
jgi:GxxExxY protein